MASAPICQRQANVGRPPRTCKNNARVPQGTAPPLSRCTLSLPMQEPLNLKPPHKQVKSYYETLSQLSHLSIDDETNDGDKRTSGNGQPR